MASYSELSEESRLKVFAPLIHDFYRETQWTDLPRKDAGDAHEDWEQLGQGYKDSNLQQANQLPTRIMKNGYTIVPKTMPSDVPAVKGFTPRQLRKLAIEEHDRWIAEKNNSGWRYAPIDKKNPALRLHPLMVPWDSLPVMERKKDLDAISFIPMLLAEAGLCLIDIESPGTKESCHCDDENKVKEQVCVQVRAIIKNTKGHLLVTLQERGHSTVWDLPGGSVGYDQRVDIALDKALHALIAEKRAATEKTTHEISRFAGSLPFLDSDDSVYFTDALFYECSVSKRPDDNQDNKPAATTSNDVDATHLIQSQDAFQVKWLAADEIIKQNDVPEVTRKFIERWIAGTGFRKQKRLL